MTMLDGRLRRSGVDTVDSGPISIDDLWDNWRRGPLRAPGSLRETFELFSLYDPAEGLDALLDRVDFEDVPVFHNYRTVLNRPPENMMRARVAQESHPRKRFRQSLLSDEFQLRLVELLLLAFPEKNRNLFLHIPKCGGTNLAVHLIPRYLSLSRAMEAKAWTEKPRMLEWIAGLMRASPMFNEVFIHGHTFFGEYIRRVGTRMHDRIFTVVRDPLDLMVSQANYNIGFLKSDPTGTRPDTRQTMRNLGIETIPHPLSPELLRELALRALLDPRIAQPNRICAYLGDGKSDMTLNNLVVHNVEVTNMQRYSAWISDRWGIHSSFRHNESQAILTRADAVAHLDALQPQISEDQVVYDHIMKVLERTERTSARGAELAG